MRRFAGGTFTQGEVMALAASPTMMMTVSPFAIDAYEVTVARFRVFWAERRTTAAPEAIRAMPIAYRGGAIAWGDPAQPPLPLDSQCNWSDTDSRVTAHPMNCLDYWLAQEFCVWDGGRLPTEAEWEFAARGSAADGLVPGRIFPWGDTAPSCDRVHFTGCSGEDGRRTRQVGRFAATAGLFDMAGNVWEWIADNYLEYPMCRGSGIDVLCSYSPTANRVFRGGSRSSDATSIRAASRFDFSPVLRNGAFGFRCARDTAL